ncbi:MAG: CBS domain-containing protein [Bacilli bacterium]|jgi:hypothetical protein
MTDNNKYSIDNTYRFLRVYAKLEANQRNYNYLDHKYPEQMKLFRHLRNDLAHNSDEDFDYPFIVSDSILAKIEDFNLEISAQAYAYATKVNKIPLITFKTSIRQVFDTLIASDFTYLPILDGKNLVRGIITTDAILKLLIQKDGGIIDINNLGFVEQYMPYFDLKASPDEVFRFIEKRALFYESLALFHQATDDKKILGAVFITQNGTNKEPLLAMMTSNDALRYHL